MVVTIAQFNTGAGAKMIKMDTAQTIFEEVVRGGATGRNVTGSDVSHVTGNHVSGDGPDRK